MTVSLIKRLTLRIRHQPFIDMQDMADVRPNPPVSKADLSAAEGVLGFELPVLVRDLYTLVADGGYGPGYGLCRIAEIVERGREFAADGSDGPWPPHFLHLCWWGCGYFSGLDCSHPQGSVLRYVPDDWTSEELIPEADSLAEWLEAWIRDERLWDRVQAE